MSELDFYKGKRVFITGYTGFKGSWLVAWLLKLGAEVSGLSRAAPTNPNHFGLLNLQINGYSGDIGILENLLHAMNESEPEIVFHFAAQSLVREGYADPVKTFASNVLGSVHVMEAVRQTPSVRALIYVTSDKCYDNEEWLWSYRENDKLGGPDPYSASKAGAELAFRCYTDSLFKTVNAASCRVGNVVGGGDWAKDRIVPDCVRAAKAGQAVELRSPNAVRPWQHVLDPLSGYLKLGAKLAGPNGKLYTGAYNFGPVYDDCRTVAEVVKALGLCPMVVTVPVQTDAVHCDTVESKEANLLRLNCEKARSKLGWKPTWGFDRTMSATAAWYSEWITGGDIRAMTETQIQTFERHMR